METKTKPLILVVEDDERLNKINSYALKSEGYEVISVSTLEMARSVLSNASPDIILLDVKLPDGNSFDFCREIRPSTTAHIVFLTAVTESAGELEGLVAGGDDYLKKPYGIELLYERIKKGLNQKQIASQRIIRGSLTLDIVSSRAFIGNEDLLLSKNEFTLLHLLIRNEGKTIPTDHIYEKIWNQTVTDNDSSVKNTVYRLRKKLGEDYNYTISYDTEANGYIFIM